MREFTIGKNDAGQRLDRFLGKTLPLLPPALAQKYIRLKRVTVNGKGSKRDVRLQQGDVLQLYINDEFFDQPTEENRFLSIFKPNLTIVYEDENLLLADKRQGLVCHADETGEFSAETMASLLRLTAWLCEEFDLAPADVIRHYDVTGKICPKYYVDHPEAWEDFRSALRAARTQENPS